jgi:hypothetical protein
MTSGIDLTKLYFGPKLTRKSSNCGQISTQKQYKQIYMYFMNNNILRHYIKALNITIIYLTLSKFGFIR